MTETMEKMGIRDLKNGYMVKLRNGETGMVQGEVILSGHGGYFYIEDEYEPRTDDEEDDLTSGEDPDYDIMRVFRPDSEGSRLEFRRLRRRILQRRMDLQQR